MISTVTNFLNICKDSVVTRRHNGIIPVLMVQSLMDTSLLLDTWMPSGAPSRRSDEQLRHEHVPGVGDRDVHLHAVPHLQILHDQVRASSEVDRLQVAN